MGKVKFKFNYPEFSNIFLSVYALSGRNTSFGGNYRGYLSLRHKEITATDREYLELFSKEAEAFSQFTNNENQLLDYFFDYRIENLIMLKRRIEKDYGEYDCTTFDRVYLYFYKKLSEDYHFFLDPITASLNRLEYQIEEQKISYYLERFHTFLDAERHMNSDFRFFVSCFYFAVGTKARFVRISPDKIIFLLPILQTHEGKITLDFDEKAFLEQIFYQALLLQFENRREKMLQLLPSEKIDQSHFSQALVGAWHYGLYSFDVHKESMNLKKLTDRLEQKILQPDSNQKQLALAIEMAPLLEQFYSDRKGMDEEFVTKTVEIYNRLTMTAESVPNVFPIQKNNPFVIQSQKSSYTEETVIVFQSEKEQQ